MEPTTEQKRANFLRVALEALGLLKPKHPRTDALGESKNDLAVLAAAVFERRKAQGIGTDESPTPHQEMAALIEKLAAAGINILQSRPGDPKPIPTPWIDPVTNSPLPPPKSLDEKTLLRKYDPALADHYEAMERDPYGHIQYLREKEAKRLALASIPYGQAEHETNPFRGTDKTAQAIFIKNATPDVVEFYRNEARDVEIPLFGKNRNMTVEGRLAKDPATFAVIKIAQRIHEDWNQQDKLAAQKQRAQAEAALKKLEETEDRKPAPRSMVG